MVNQLVVTCVEFFNPSTISPGDPVLKRPLRYLGVFFIIIIIMTEEAQTQLLAAMLTTTAYRLHPLRVQQATTRHVTHNIFL